MRTPEMAGKLKELFGVTMEDKPADSSEMTPRVRALLKKYGLLDEGAADTEDNKAKRQVGE